MKLKSIVLVGATILLTCLVLGYRFLNPAPDPKLEANLEALKRLGVPVSLADLEATRAKGTPDAAIAYDKAITQFQTTFGSFSQAEQAGFRKLKVGQPTSEAEIRLIKALEPVWATLALAASKASFVPDRGVTDWELNNSMLSNGHYELCNYLNMRLAAQVNSNHADDAYQTVELSLKIGRQVGSYPGLVASNLGTRWTHHGFTNAIVLAGAMSKDKDLNQKLLKLVESQRLPDAKRAYVLQPAIAFAILDSKKPIPFAFAPNGYQNTTPEPARGMMLENKRTRQAAKAILADYFRNLIENFPEDATDTKAISSLVQDERLDPRSFEGELASKLAIPNWRIDGGRLLSKAQQDAIRAIRANLSK